MVAGGIGVTPCMGILKDVYEIGLTEAQRDDSTPCAIDSLYLLWVIPHMEDYECFRPELEALMKESKLPNRPTLNLMVYITRSKEKLVMPFVAGRPDVANLFRVMMEDHDDDDAALVFACGPQALVSETWDQSIHHTMQGKLVDFHHEIFDF